MRLQIRQRRTIPDTHSDSESSETVERGSGGAAEIERLALDALFTAAKFELFAQGEGGEESIEIPELAELGDYGVRGVVGACMVWAYTGAAALQKAGLRLPEDDVPFVIVNPETGEHMDASEAAPAAPGLVWAMQVISALVRGDGDMATDLVIGMVGGAGGDWDQVDSLIASMLDTCVKTVNLGYRVARAQGLAE